MKFNKSLLNEALEAVSGINTIEESESVDPFDLDFADVEPELAADDDLQNAQLLVTEAVDNDLDKKLDTHNAYIEYLRKEIEGLEASIKNEKNDEIKTAKENYLAELNQALETALPDAVKAEAPVAVGATPETEPVAEDQPEETTEPEATEQEEEIDLDEFLKA